MASDGVHTGSSTERMVTLVDAYARRVYPAVLRQHPGASVSSPLGVWLLLAACAAGARGASREAIERTLGCSAEEARELLAAIMDAPPRALAAAVAVWTAGAATAELTDWVRALPPAVESGAMPTQAQADAWASEHTLGLIRAFPLTLDATTRIVLASALATKVSWSVPFDVVPADAHLAPGSPWRGRVGCLLWDGEPRDRATIADTVAAGLVAVHWATAREGLTVISVSAAPGTEREAVLTAAHELAAGALRRAPLPARSLFDLPLGTGHSWEIAERPAHVPQAGARLERISGASLPAWSIASQLELLASDLFGVPPALDAVRELIGARPSDGGAAAQAAVADYGRYGFEAAAVTAFSVMSARLRPPDQTGVERSAVLRFDHPYAAIAVASDDRFAGLPLFTAWVDEPREPEDAPPATSDPG